MSSVIDFCERHNQTRMLNLLRNSGTVTNTMEILALDVLEEIVAGKQDMVDAIKEIKRGIHPVEKARKHHVIVSEQEARLSACNAEIKGLNIRIERMHKELASGFKQAQNKKRSAPVVEFESQAFEVSETQPDQAEVQENIALAGRSAPIDNN
jgi:hypothetical protein